MGVSRRIVSALVLPLVLVSSQSTARIARSSEMVGPPMIQLYGRCAARFEALGGTRIGGAIPIPALRLGAPVSRGSTSFTTGGSGTARLTEIERRKRAGLPYAPKIFDVAGSVRPETYSADGTEARWLEYQQLTLRSLSRDYDPNGLIFALATSATDGRIASLQLTLRRAPTAKPKLRITAGARDGAPECAQVQNIDVYAPAMTADRIRGLFDAWGSCSWYQPTACKRSEWPRGQVLFVQRQGAGYVNRWIDYDLLAGMHFSKAAPS